MILDPATITYCPCGRQIQQGKDEYFVCRPCWLSAVAYWRILFSRGGADRERAKKHILEHAERRKLCKN